MSYLTATGWLTQKERRFIFTSAESASIPATILNVGVEYGASVVCILEGNPEATVYAVDLDTSKYDAYRGGRLQLIKNDSRDYLKSLPNEPTYDFAFIDGDHSYNGALGDAREAGLRMRVGAIIAFHDCYSWDVPMQDHAICPEVNQAIGAWFSDNKDKFEELPFIDSIRAFRRKA